MGVFCRAAPSTRAIIRSRKDSPGLAVMRTTIRSERTRVPPVTALRSPPLSRMTGADSPVMALSSTEAMPSMISPSPGMYCPASTTTVSPLRRVAAETFCSDPSTSFRASTSLRIFRSEAACALPRPSATASAKLANSTVNQSQSDTSPVNHSGVPRCAAPRSMRNSMVVSTAPTSTTNITGFRITSRGESLRKLSQIAGRTMEGSKSESSRVVEAMTQ